MNLNTVTFEGNLVDVPELSITPNTQTAVAEAVVLVNRKTRVTLPGGAEEWTAAEPTRYRIKARRSLAEHLAEMPKGTRLLVVGYVVTETWTDKVSHEKRAQDVVMVDGVGPSLRYGGVHIGAAIGSREGGN